MNMLDHALFMQCIAFHSYKGGTGKTTIACNLAALLTAKGYNVSLLDLDVYAPSLHAYFDYAPEKWVNDLLAGDAGIEDVMVDMTSIVDKYYSKGQSTALNKKGKLQVGFSSSQKEEIYKLEGGGVTRPTGTKLQLLRRFIQLREDLISDYYSDFVIIDTSPGIRYWSINSLAIADTLFLTLKLDDLDIEGTKKMVTEIYGSFTKFGAKSYLLLNRVAGYCMPTTLVSSPRSVPSHDNSSTTTATITMPQQSESDFSRAISNEISMDVISAIPCYCDIQFSRKEFLTGLQYPAHPFAKQLERLASSVNEIKV